MEQTGTTWLIHLSVTFHKRRELLLSVHTGTSLKKKRVTYVEVVKVIHFTCRFFIITGINLNRGRSTFCTCSRPLKFDLYPWKISKTWSAIPKTLFFHKNPNLLELWYMYRRYISTCTNVYGITQALRAQWLVFKTHI